MVLLWIAVALIAALGFFIAGLWVGAKGILSWPETVNFILTTPNDEAWIATVEALQCCGVKPKQFLNSSFAKRAFMSHRIIVNTVDPEQEARKYPAGLVVVEWKPYFAARAATDRLEERGHDSDIIVNPDPNVPNGAMHFVHSTAFPWLLVFRKPDWLMGAHPEPWDWDRVRAAVRKPQPSTPAA